MICRRRNQPMEQKVNKRANARIIAVMVIMYVIVAMSDNFKGIFVPTFKENIA